MFPFLHLVLSVSIMVIKQGDYTDNYIWKNEFFHINYKFVIVIFIFWCIVVYSSHRTRLWLYVLFSDRQSILCTLLPWCGKRMSQARLYLSTTSVRKSSILKRKWSNKNVNTIGIFTINRKSSKIDGNKYTTTIYVCGFK